VPIVDLAGLDPQARARQLDALLDGEATTPFDLVRGPVVRAHLVLLGPDEHLLVTYCHHILFDGWSAGRLMKDVAAAYRALGDGRDPFPTAATPFSAFVARAAERAQGPAQQESLAHFERVFLPALPPPLDLPTDRPRPVRRSFLGGTVHHAVDDRLHAVLKAACRRQGATMYSFLLAGFEVLLSRLSGQDDLVVGVPAAGQAHLGIDAVGYGVNMLPLRARPAGARRFAEFLAETSQGVLDAFEHQDVTLGRLLAHLDVPRDPSRLPLVEVVFRHTRYFADVRIDGVEISGHENRRRAVYHDLFLNMTDSGGHLLVDCDYNADLFDEATVRRWITHLEVLLEVAATRPDASLDDLPLLSEAEVDRLVAHRHEN
jgi:hypothetical protein